MNKYTKNKPIKIKKYMYEFAQEMGIGAVTKNKSAKNTRGTS